MLPISPTSSRLTTSSSSPNRASSCSAPDPENRGGPCRTRRCTPPTGPLPAKTGPVSVEGTSGASGPGPDDFGPVLGYYEGGPTPREAGPGGPAAASDLLISDGVVRGRGCRKSLEFPVFR